MNVSLKFLVKFLSMAMLFFVSVGAVAQAKCSVAKVGSLDDSDQQVWGTGFAISTTHLLVNDHTLGRDGSAVKVLVEGQQKPVMAKVLGRDFYNDLAVIEISADQNLEACTLATMPAVKVLDPVIVKGFEHAGQAPFVISTRIMSVASEKLEIPGVVAGIELKTDAYRPTMSGSAVIKGSEVVGILAARTKEGTALVIPMSIIQRAIPDLIAGNIPKRKFQFDRKAHNFAFSGMTLSGAAQVAFTNQERAGDPHGVMPQKPGGSNDPSTDEPIVVAGDPHGKITPRNTRPDVYGTQSGTQMVSGTVTGLGYVVAEVYDAQILNATQPDVAALAQASGTKFVMIRSVDRVPTPTLLDLIRILGTCTQCRIDSFMVISPDPQALSNSYHQGFAYVSRLAASMSKTQKPSIAHESSRLLQFVADDFLQLANETNLRGAVNPESITLVRLHWNAFEKLINKIVLNDEQYDLLYEIRSRLP